MFFHKPLEPGHIRLLRISPGEDEDQLVCSIIHKSLFSEETPELENLEPVGFVALSYTWGPESPTKEILVEDEVFEIRENLWNFLRRLRDDEHEDFFWADAICINQDDTEEKNAQVALMGMIFYFAQAVFVWLGVEADYSFIMMTPIVLLNFLSGKGLPFGINKRPSASEQLEMWEATLAFCRRPYWRRAWVVQEIALARGEIYAYCGPSVVRYRALVAGIDLLLMKWHHTDPEVAPWKREENNIARKRIAEILQELDQFKPPKAGPSGIRDLFDVLIRYADTECSDPRDKVFAFLGMATDTSASDCTFKVDYSKSVIEVFFQALMFYNDPRYGSWGVSMPKFGKKLMQSMSLSPEEVQNYLSAQDIVNGTTTIQSDHEDVPRVTAVFEILGVTENVASFVPPFPTFRPDVWIVFEVPKHPWDEFKNAFRGIATTQVEDGDYVHCAVDSDVALIVRHQDGYRDIESWAVVNTDPSWTPQEVDLDRVGALHDNGRQIGQFESLSEPHAHFFRLMLRPRDIMRVPLPVAVALIQGSDEPHERYIDEPHQRDIDESQRKPVLDGPPNWRGYEWPALYCWLRRVRSRWRDLVSTIRRAFWSLRWRCSSVLRDSVSTRNEPSIARETEGSVSTRSESSNTGETEGLLRRGNRDPNSPLYDPNSDEMVRALGDTWLRLGESRRW
jgi:hypothetical protein